MGYKLKLDIFEGPLDLLLYLIRKNDIEVTDIPIVEITDQYMEYIEMMQLLDLDIVGDFLVMAATLMHIKSRMLLPPDPDEEEEEDDPRKDLARRLMEYRQFKEIAGELEEKELARKKLFERALGSEEKERLQDDAREIFFEASLFDLINALTDALKRTPEDILHEIVQEEFTIEDKVHDILHRLVDEPVFLLSDLFHRARSKNEIIVTFVALLELIRLKEVLIVQTRLFDDIEVQRNQDKITSNIQKLPADPVENNTGMGETPESQDGSPS